jgi:hypothetical protein
MTRRPETSSWAVAISTIALLLLATACSSPKRESPASPPAAELPAARKPAPPATAAPTAGRSIVAERQAPTPPEIPVAAPVAPTAPASRPNAKPAEPAPDALKWMQESEARRVAYEQSLTRLAAERDAAAEIVARRQRDVLAFKNPYLARPKLSPDEAEEIRGMDGIARVKWAQDHLDAAKATLDAAQAAYDDAKASPPHD